MRNLIKKHLEENKRGLIAIFIVLAAIFLVYLLSRESSYLQNAVYCRFDEDCILYDCSSCGNRRWVKKNFLNEFECGHAIPGLIGCVCVDSLCKRNYSK